MAIYIANGMGLMLLSGILMGNAFKMQKKTESCMLYLMAIVLIICCIVDPIVFTVDGKPGLFYTVILYVGNLLLYIANLVYTPLFLLLIERNSMGTNSKRMLKVILVVDLIFLGILVINFFEPIVFFIDASNRYRRLPLFFLYTATGMVYIAAAIVIYLISRYKGGSFKSFPVVELVAPMFIGLIVQGYFYGISLIWPASAVGLTLMVLTIQNRNLLLDPLTGLYNRKYLERFEQPGLRFCLMMLDLNDFKTINDTYGHSEGDAAIVQAADLILSAVGNLGTAVRFAGDEFIILLNTRDSSEAEVCIRRVQRTFAEYNRKSSKPYKITYSLGWGIFDSSQSTMDEILKTIDERMYDDKHNYYEKNDRRRK